jgi:hypothetical protein
MTIQLLLKEIITLGLLRYALKRRMELLPICKGNNSSNKERIFMLYLTPLKVDIVLPNVEFRMMELLHFALYDGG